MLKKLILFLILLPLVCGEEFSQYTSITTEVNVSGLVNLNYLEGDSKLDYFETKLNFFPISDVNQNVKIMDFNSEPSANIIEDGNIKFKWSNENIKKINYGLNTEVVSKTLFKFVDKTIKYPINGLTDEDKKYIEEREYTDLNGDIREKAKEIAKNEEDFYLLVFNVAEWVRTNVKYDLNSLTEKSVKKSSWVLERRQGVCDEITNLFTSLLRSLGIPVKYVSGLAYSDVVGGWSAHAWSEVYFPNYGWLPFDVTFGQYGWVDAGHIKMMEGFDANEPSVEYNWRAIKVNIDNKEFSAGASLKEKGDMLNPLLDLNLKLLKNNVGEGSYIPIEVTVKNLQPFYVSSLVYVNVAPDLVGSNSKSVLLKPLQEKRLYWLINISEKLNKGLIYTGEVVVKDSFGSVSKQDLNFAESFEVVNYDEVAELMDELIKEEENIKAYDLSLNCETDKKDYYRYENLNVECSIENEGNMPLSVNICLKEDCKNIDLNINEDKKINFIFNLENYKEKLFVNAVSGKNIENALLNFEVYDAPVFRIENISCGEIKYSEKGEISIDVNAVPNIEKLEIEIDKVDKITFNNISGFRTLKIPFKAWEFNEGSNNIDIKFKYYNKEKVYESKKNFTLEIKKINFLEKIFISFRRLF